MSRKALYWLRGDTGWSAGSGSLLWPDEKEYFKLMMLGVTKLVTGAPNQHVSDKAYQLFSALFHVSEVLQAFRKHADSRGGLEKIANTIDLTRNGLGVRLKILGLEVNDFRDPTAKLRALMHKSIVGTIAQKIESQ